VQARKHAHLPETEVVDITGLSQADQKKVETAFKNNREAVGMWTHAGQSLALMNVVNRTKTREWPSGQAWEIRKSLDESITPKDLPARVKMLSELSLVELKPEEHPKILFEKIEAIQCKYAQEYSTADAIATILRAAPREYAGVIASVHINKGSNMTENDLKAAMSLTFRSDIKGKNRGYVDGQSGRQKEVALSNVDGKKETRRCHNCHEKGHIAADCKVVIKCEICGGRHKTIACFEDPRNAHRRPNNWESKLSEAEKKRHFGGEKAMANIGGDGEKCV
jgi:hypothetical protein